MGGCLLLGVLYAALGAFTFVLNNVAMRRGVVTGSVLQGMAMTVPIGGRYLADAFPAATPTPPLKHCQRDWPLRRLRRPCWRDRRRG
jgi:hypothetical protein